VGVEIGQLAFVGVVFALLRIFRSTTIRWPAAVEVAPLYLIGIAGAAWMFQWGAAVLEGPG
jgi:hypothetical protein